MKKPKTLLPVIEIFYSIQGEAFSIGKPAVFVRFGGCDLRCKFCDTKYAFEPKNWKWMKTYDIAKKIRSYPTKLVIFTGGEPLLYQNGISKILHYLPKKYKIEIETNGTIWPFPISMRHKIQYNVSSKLESSGNLKSARYKPEILKEFNRLGAIFKFVIQTEKDWKEMEKIIKEIKIPPERVWVMPEGTSIKVLKKRSLWLIPKIKKKGYNYSPRLQIWLWGKKRGV